MFHEIVGKIAKNMDDTSLIYKDQCPIVCQVTIALISVNHIYVTSRMSIYMQYL